jgi:hypothetical protein
MRLKKFTKEAALPDFAATLTFFASGLMAAVSGGVMPPPRLRFSRLPVVPPPADRWSRRVGKRSFTAQQTNSRGVLLLIGATT